MKKLGVFLNSDCVGTLEQGASGILRFVYAPDWLAREDASPLSKTLPLSPEPYEGKQARPFFAGILPEEGPRARVAAMLGISVENDFGLLDRIGGECAGSVSLIPEGEKPSGPTNRVRTLKEDELATITSQLPEHPFLADEQGVRLSLAGVQDKLPVVIADGKIAVPLGGTPSTHIIKPEPDRFPGFVANELFCMKLARQVGLNVAEVTSLKIGGKPCMVVTRYDRIPGKLGIVRLHQEDFCQALGRPPERKYQQEGGPTVDESIGLLREWSTMPVLDILGFVDALIFNAIIGNADAHGKNYSILYDHGSRRLAPLCDLISTVAWPGLSSRPAMSIGNQANINDLQAGHFQRMALDSGLGWPSVRERLYEFAGIILAANKKIGGAHKDKMSRRVGEIVTERCERILGQR